MSAFSISWPGTGSCIAPERRCFGHIRFDLCDRAVPSAVPRSIEWVCVAPEEVGAVATAGLSPHAPHEDAIGNLSTGQLGSSITSPQTHCSPIASALGGTLTHTGTGSCPGTKWPQVSSMSSTRREGVPGFGGGRVSLGLGLLQRQRKAGAAPEPSSQAAPGPARKSHSEGVKISRIIPAFNTRKELPSGEIF